MDLLESNPKIVQILTLRIGYTVGTENPGPAPKSPVETSRVARSAGAEPVGTKGLQRRCSALELLEYTAVRHCRIVAGLLPRMLVRIHDMYLYA